MQWRCVARTLSRQPQGERHFRVLLVGRDPTECPNESVLSEITIFAVHNKLRGRLRCRFLHTSMALERYSTCGELEKSPVSWSPVDTFGMKRLALNRASWRETDHRRASDSEPTGARLCHDGCSEPGGPLSSRVGFLMLLLVRCSPDINMKSSLGHSVGWSTRLNGPHWSWSMWSREVCANECMQSRRLQDGMSPTP